MKQNKLNRVKQNLLFGFLAQLGEQHSYKMKVIGSSPVESISLYMILNYNIHNYYII